MHRFRPVQALASEDWIVRHYIVVKSCSRKLVSGLAHNFKGGRAMVIRKTYKIVKKILLVRFEKECFEIF